MANAFGRSARDAKAVSVVTAVAAFALSFAIPNYKPQQAGAQTGDIMLDAG